MRLITKDTDYAMRALVHMAQNAGGMFSVREIAEKLDIPHAYLRKLLQKLNAEGFLTSVKGKNGGFKMKRKPEEILLKSLIAVFQGKVEITHCVVRSEQCPRLKNCYLHQQLVRYEALLNQELGAINISTLAEPH